MTPNTQALQRLLDAVETEEGPGNHVFVLDTVDQVKWCVEAYNGSLDAAKALHDALLPRGKLFVRFAQHADGHYCEITGSLPDDAPKWTYPVVYSGKASNPARAWLLAIIRAVMAGER